MQAAAEHLRTLAAAIERGVPAAELLEGLGAALAAMHVASGDRRFSGAASMLRKPAGGRPTIDDADRLADVRAMLRSGRTSSVAQACLWVARSHPDRGPGGAKLSEAATADRLRRKHRAGAEK